MISLSLSVGMAASTSTPSLFGDEGIRRIVSMAIGAMSLSLLFRAACFSAASQSFFENSASRIKHFGQGEPLCGALDYGVGLQTALLRKFDSQIFSPLDLHEAIVSRISLLFLSRCPSAVARFVISILIWKSIKRMLLGGTRPHVCDEISENLPSFADRYSSTAVILPLLCFRISTAIKHSLPDGIKRMRVLKRHIGLLGSEA